MNEKEKETRNENTAQPNFLLFLSSPSILIVHPYSSFVDSLFSSGLLPPFGRWEVVFEEGHEEREMVEGKADGGKRSRRDDG